MSCTSGASTSKRLLHRLTSSSTAQPLQVIWKRRGLSWNAFTPTASTPPPYSQRPALWLDLMPCPLQWIWVSQLADKEVRIPTASLDAGEFAIRTDAAARCKFLEWLLNETRELNATWAPSMTIVAGTIYGCFYYLQSAARRVAFRVQTAVKTRNSVAFCTQYKNGK